MQYNAFSFASFFHASMAGATARKKLDKRNYLNLSSNEFVHRGITSLVERELRRVGARDVTHYPYWAAFERDLAMRVGADESTIMVTAGSDSAYKMLLCCLRHSENRVLTQAPNYEQLGFYAAMLGIRLTEIPYRRKRGFVLDDFVAALDVPSTSIWISNPNGPSGWRMPSAEVASLAADCHGRGHALIIDEAYADFADCSHLDLVARYPNAVVIRSFSKGWAMAGARLAYLAASPELVSYLRAWNPENPISGSTLELARALREREPEFVRARRELNAARDWFADAAARQIPGAEALPSEANFVNIDVGSEAFAAHLSNALHAHGILVRVMTEATRLGGCLRVTAAEHDVLASVLDIACDAAQSFRSDFDERDRHGVR